MVVPFSFDASCSTFSEKASTFHKKGSTFEYHVSTFNIIMANKSSTSYSSCLKLLKKTEFPPNYEQKLGQFSFQMHKSRYHHR